MKHQKECTKSKDEKRLTFMFIGEKIKNWKFFDSFFLIPTIATFDENVYQYGKKWMYMRIFAFYFLWYSFHIEWKHGLAENYK